MSFPKARSSQKPQILRTDKWEIRMHHDAGIARFYRIRVVLGEPVANDTATFSLRLVDFKHYEDVLQQFIEIQIAWRNHWHKNS